MFGLRRYFLRTPVKSYSAAARGLDISLLLASSPLICILFINGNILLLYSYCSKDERVGILTPLQAAKVIFLSDGVLVQLVLLSQASYFSCTFSTIWDFEAARLPSLLYTFWEAGISIFPEPLIDCDW